MTDYAKLKVVELKAKLKGRGLLQTGLKQALVDRLIENDNTAASEAASVPDSVSEEAPGDSNVPAQVNGTPQGPSQVASTDEAPSALISIPPVPETVEDSRKRKRRSQSPLVSTQETLKKLKQLEDVSSETPIIEEPPPADDHTITEETVMQDPSSPRAEASASLLVEDETIAEAPADTSEKGREVDRDEARVMSQIKSEGANTASSETEQDLQNSNDQPTEAMAIDTKEIPDPAPQNPSASPSDPRDREAQLQPFTDVEPIAVKTKSPSPSDHFIIPAIHPTTSALYIREFSRPLQVPALQKHLIALATPSSVSDFKGADRSSSEPPEADPAILKRFHISTLRTHVLLLFSTAAAAARVRAALHNNVWPLERNRKALWADFIPADKVNEWIEHEVEGESTARGGGSRVGGKKWEVLYRDSADGQGIEAVHQEIGPGGSAVPPRRELTVRTAPKDQTKPQAFVALDSLFSSTTAKPKLYYKPVAKVIADRRVEILERSRDRSGGGDLKRYTFEDGDSLVDSGLDRGPPAGYRPRGGGDRFGGRGYGNGRGDRNGRRGGAYGGQSYRFGNGRDWRN
ncbi:MAG: hypothetical protein M1814_002087 [Vezdaea aestivalis]|nr:MAG: hypothetical protein M1814_002087 [Vezdaea aestivalis]